MLKDNSRPRELLILTIDLGHTKDEIRVKPTDTPLSLARSFCKKHNLSSDVEASVSQYLMHTLTIISSTPTASKAKTPQSRCKSDPKIIPRVKRSTRGSSQVLVQNSSAKTERSSSPPKKSATILPGERLYYKAVDELRTKNEYITKMLQEKEEKELNGLTFRPEINQRNRFRSNNYTRGITPKGDKKISFPIQPNRLSIMNMLNELT